MWDLTVQPFVPLCCCVNSFVPTNISLCANRNAKWRVQIDDDDDPVERQIALRWWCCEVVRCPAPACASQPKPKWGCTGWCWWWSSRASDDCQNDDVQIQQITNDDVPVDDAENSAEDSCCLKLSVANWWWWRWTNLPMPSANATSSLMRRTKNTMTKVDVDQNIEDV